MAKGKESSRSFIIAFGVCLGSRPVSPVVSECLETASSCLVFVFFVVYILDLHAYAGRVIRVPISVFFFLWTGGGGGGENRPSSYVRGTLDLYPPCL